MHSFAIFPQEDRKIFLGKFQCNYLPSSAPWNFNFKVSKTSLIISPLDYNKKFIIFVVKFSRFLNSNDSSSTTVEVQICMIKSIFFKSLWIKYFQNIWNIILRGHLWHRCNSSNIPWGLGRPGPNRGLKNFQSCYNMDVPILDEQHTVVNW